MQREELRALALDTLYGRRMEKCGCFVTNQAGFELAECSPEALPVIEEIIDTIVIPTLRDSNQRTEWERKMSDVSPNIRRFMEYDGGMTGLSHLLGAILLYGVRNEDPNFYGYLKQSAPEVREKAIYCVETFFRWMGNEYNFGVAPNEALRDYVREELVADNDIVCVAAERIWRKFEPTTDTH